MEGRSTDGHYDRAIRLSAPETKESSMRSRVRHWLSALLAVAFASVMLPSQSMQIANASGVGYATGDVFVGVGNGMIKHFSPTGTLLDTLNTGSGSSEDTGMCFDTSGNLRSTNFEANDMSLFDNKGNLTKHPWGSGFDADPESCVHD